MLVNAAFVALAATLAVARQGLPGPARLPAAGAPALPALTSLPTPPSKTTPNSPAASSPAPTLVLDYGSFIGFNEDGVTNFLGVPFVQPPVGDLRYRLPVSPPHKFDTIQNATLYGPSCTQLGGNQDENAVFAALPPSVGQKIGEQTAGQVLTVGESEDCLTINVKIPDGPVPEGGFPILIWIFGGGFTNGGTASYEGAPIVRRSAAIGTPVIYVSMNYRLNGWGFFNAKELSAEGVGNLGLWDQRAGMQWVKKYASQFSGNPDKTTIWGESAGAISVGHQLLGNGGNPDGLFRGAFSNSGTQIPVGGPENSQIYFDETAKNVSCFGLPDVLACMRLVPYAQLRDAINLLPNIFAYQSLDEVFLPRVDGTFINQTSQSLVLDGKYARVPVVTGDCDDEGTLFSILGQTNVTTNEDGNTYLRQFFFPQATDEEAASALALYPSDPVVGSPFDTGELNQLTPQFKRIASFQGDFAFQAPRRYFLNIASKTQNVWSFIYKRSKALPFLGSFHGTDIVEGMYAPGSGSAFGDFQLMDYLINFVVYLDPNGPGNATNLLAWPKWDNTLQSPAMMTFTDAPVVAAGVLGLSITLDTFRAAPMAFLQFLGVKYPI